MQKGIRYVYIGMIIMGFLLILTSGYFTLEGTQSVKLETREPILVTQEVPEEKCYFFDVSNMDNLGLDVVFFSHHQFVRVFADGEEIYSEQKNGGIWGHTNGSVWNFVTIPYGSSQLEIRFVAAYQSVQNEEHVFYFGDKLDIYEALFKESTLSLFISFILIIAGIAMILYGSVISRQVHAGKGMLYLGVFTMLFGLWSFNETDAATLIFNHRITASFSAYIFLMMMSSSFILFVRELIQIEEQKVWKILCNVSVIELIVCILLQFAGIADLKQTVFVTHIIMVIAILYVIGALAYKIYKGNVLKSIKMNLVALIVLITASVGDMVFYYMGAMDADIFGRFIFLIFVLILGGNTLMESIRMLERGKKAQIYEELAITDILTGLRNRNAYETDVAELEDTDGMMMITFDLNNLKKCNDTYGHSEGDHCIKAAANVIETVFAPYGNCYRIGGDEFLVLVKKGKRCPIQQLLNHMREEERKYNENSATKFALHIAVGYTLYDREKDGSIESARDRADDRMYENKKQLKKSV